MNYMLKIGIKEGEEEKSKVRKKYISVLIALLLSCTIIGCLKDDKEKNHLNSNQGQVNKIGYLEEGNIAFSKGDIEKALEYYDKVDLKEIRDSDKLHLSFIYNNLGQFDKSQKVIDSMEGKALRNQFKDSAKKYKEEEFLYKNAEDIINKFLKLENKYINKIQGKEIKPDDKTLYNQLISNLTSNSSMKTLFRFIQESGKMSNERVYRNLSSQYDEVREIKLDSINRAKIKCDRYFTYSQTNISGFFLCRVEYELVKENEKWLINDFEFKEKPVIIERDRSINMFSIDGKYKTFIEGLIKNNSWNNSEIKSTNYVEYEVKGKKEGYITSIIERYGKEYIWTSLIVPKQNRFNMRGSKDIEIEDRYVLSNVMLFPIKGTDLVNKETFLSIYNEVREILVLEKPTDKPFSDKSPIIVTILNKDNTYYVVYYDRYNVEANCADYNIAEFIKNGDKLELKSNSQNGKDLYI